MRRRQHMHGFAYDGATANDEPRPAQHKGVNSTCAEVLAGLPNSVCRGISGGSSETCGTSHYSQR